MRYDIVITDLSTTEKNHILHFLAFNTKHTGHVIEKGESPAEPQPEAAKGPHVTSTWISETLQIPDLIAMDLRNCHINLDFVALNGLCKLEVWSDTKEEGGVIMDRILAKLKPKLTPEPQAKPESVPGCSFKDIFNA